MTGTQGRTRLGHFLGPHGVQGGVKLFVLGDPVQLHALNRVFVEGRGWLRVQRVEALPLGVALHLAGVLSREAAEDLRGLPVFAADDELPPLEAGVYYYHELRGLPLRDAEGHEVGEVADVFDGGHQDLLVVRHASGESLLPLQAPYVVVHLSPQSRPASLSLAEDAPEGLLEGSATETPRHHRLP